MTTVDKVMLTTVDNPWNPFTHYDDWLAYDEAMGYFTNSLLARVTISSDELSEADQDLAYEQGVDEVVRENVSGMHRKVFANETFPPSDSPDQTTNESDEA